MYGIVKCLPTSRSQSISRISASQSRLLTMHRARRARRSRGTARAGPGSTATLTASVSRSSRFRSADARRVADHAGPAADERDRPAAVALELEEAHDRDEVADVEPRPGRVEAVVAGDRTAGGEAGREARRRVVEHPPPGRARRAVPSPRRAPSPAEARRRRRRRHRLARRAVTTGQKRGCSRPLCYRAARHADQPRAAAAPSAQPRPRAAPRLLRRPESRHRDPDHPLRRPSSWSAWRAWSASPPPTTTTARGCPIPRTP